MEALVLVDTDLQDPVEASATGAEVWAYSHRSPDKSSGSEDAALVWDLGDDGVLLAVADGVGGAPSGGAAASLAIEAVSDACRARSPGDDLRPSVLDAFEDANRRVLELGVGAGTTLVVAQLCGSALRVYHVGDSEALLVGQRGRIKLETMPHSPVGYGVAAGLIDPDLALGHDDRHFLSNHIGSTGMRIEVGSALEMATHDTLVLASDGLFDNLLPAEIADLVRCGPLRGVAFALCGKVRDRMAGIETGKPDDATFLLCRRRRGV